MTRLSSYHKASPLSKIITASPSSTPHSLETMTEITIDKDETMVSFDVVSLFTVNKACAYIRTKLEHDPSLTEKTQLVNLGQKSWNDKRFVCAISVGSPLPPPPPFNVDVAL